MRIYLATEFNGIHSSQLQTVCWSVFFNSYISILEVVCGYSFWMGGLTLQLFSTTPLAH